MGKEKELETYSYAIYIVYIFRYEMQKHRVKDTQTCAEGLIKILGSAPSVGFEVRLTCLQILILLLTTT